MGCSSTAGPTMAYSALGKFKKKSSSTAVLWQSQNPQGITTYIIRFDYFTWQARLNKPSTLLHNLQQGKPCPTRPQTCKGEGGVLWPHRGELVGKQCICIRKKFHNFKNTKIYQKILAYMYMPIGPNFQNHNYSVFLFNDYLYVNAKCLPLSSFELSQHFINSKQICLMFPDSYEHFGCFQLHHFL